MQELSISPVDMIIFVGVVQGIVFALIALISDLRNERAIVYLALTVLFLSLNNLQYWLVTTQITASFLYYKHFLLPRYFLIVPTFYQFFAHYLQVADRLPDFSPLTYSLFTIGVLIRVGLLSYVHFVAQNPAETTLLVTYNLVEETFCLIYSTLIFMFAFYALARNKNWYSFVLGFDNLAWIKQFFTYGTFVLMLWVGAVLQQYLIGFFKPPESYYPVRLGTSFLIYWIGYRGLFRYWVLREQIALRKQINEEVENLPPLDSPLPPHPLR